MSDYAYQDQHEFKKNRLREMLTDMKIDFETKVTLSDFFKDSNFFADKIVV